MGAHNPLANAEGVLYKDIEGKKGRCSYIRLDQGLRVRLYFYDNKAVWLFIGIPRNLPAARP